VSSFDPGVNEAFAAYISATEADRSDCERSLIKALQKYAKTIVWQQLHEDRPDLVNEAVERAFHSLKSFEGRSQFHTWVHVIARRVCYSELTKKIRRRNTEIPLSEYQDDTFASYELDGDARMTLDRIRRSLSPDENELIELKLQGYSNPEIASRLGVSTSTINGRWHRLCVKLRNTERSRRG
jgi:RNA polymerase sigma factor (sigma-70 family)